MQRAESRAQIKQGGGTRTASTSSSILNESIVSSAEDDDYWDHNRSMDHGGRPARMDVLLENEAAHYRPMMASGGRQRMNTQKEKIVLNLSLIHI